MKVKLFPILRPNMSKPSGLLPRGYDGYEVDSSQRNDELKRMLDFKEVDHVEVVARGRSQIAVSRTETRLGDRFLVIKEGRRVTETWPW